VRALRPEGQAEARVRLPCQGARTVGRHRLERRGRRLMAAPRIFISYSTKDRRRGASLYADLRKAGAAAFQFGESETAGKPAWEEIVRWIGECDAFVVL